MTARRTYRCCVEGCTRPRKKWQAICEVCFKLLRGHDDIRAELIGGHKAGDIHRRRAAGVRAAAVIAGRSAGAAAWAERADLR